KKLVSTSKGMTFAQTSPFFAIRNAHMAKKLNTVKKLMKQKNFTAFGELIEAEALEMHAIMITSSPSLIYWSEGTLKLMKLVKQWRQEGLPVYFTINTGQDIHLLVESLHVSTLEEKLKHIPDVKKVFVNKPGSGSYITEQHLF
ncbi:MAG: diphosphomevalonate decarboxylase, partial [Patescibacteria group bacterium]|nr:diphosphomevalonate decarboxylase [Patescibacteria group bacterium]